MGILENVNLDLRQKRPHEFGLAGDELYLEIRKKFYPQSAQGMSRFEMRAWGIPCRVLMPFVAYEASPFLNPQDMENLDDLWRWVQSLRGEKSWDLCLMSRLSLSQSNFLRDRLGPLAVATREQKIWAVEPRGTFEDYLAQKSYRFRKQYRFQQNALKAAGVTFGVLESVGGLFDLYQRRHLIKGDGDYSIETRFQAFLEELWSALARQGRLCARCLCVEGPIAGIMAFTHQGNLHVYQYTYDPAYEKLSPGRHVMLGLIKDQWEQGHSLIDFMTEREFGAPISGTHLGYQQVQLFAPTWRGHMLAQKSRWGSIFRSFKRRGRATL